MSNHHYALREYLFERSKNRIAAEAAQAALDSLAPFENIDSQRGYPLCRASAVNVSELGSAMWTAFGRPVSRCAFLHAKVPITERPWGDDAFRLGDLLYRYDELCPHTITCDPEFDKAFAYSVGNRLELALHVTLGDVGLLNGDFSPARMLLRVLRMRVAVYASQRPEAKNLDPLANILLRAIPVVGSTRKRGEWFVVVQ